MQISKISEDFSVTGQILPEEVTAIAQTGFKSIICNRPDNEEFNQPQYASIEQAAASAGISVTYIPIVHGQAGMPEVQAFKKALEDMPGPVLAYCRSGARSAAMYNAVQSIR